MAEQLKPEELVTLQELAVSSAYEIAVLVAVFAHRRTDYWGVTPAGQHANSKTKVATLDRVGSVGLTNRSSISRRSPSRKNRKPILSTLPPISRVRTFRSRAAFARSLFFVCALPWQSWMDEKVSLFDRHLPGRRLPYEALLDPLNPGLGRGGHRPAEHPQHEHRPSDPLHGLPLAWRRPVRQIPHLCALRVTRRPRTGPSADPSCPPQC